jgi:UDP-glucose 4-epimerase
LQELSIYGDDYPISDGTGVRNYIHVVDLARGHVAVVQYLHCHKGVHVWNLGTGIGYSVKEVVRAFSQSSGVDIPCKIVARRPGDIAECWSDPRKALRQLGWKSEKSLNDMVADMLRWKKMNPNGYKVKK